jgi:hypothetical protein
MRPVGHTRFIDLEKPLFVRRALNLGDQGIIEVGTVLDWKKLDISEWEVKRWFRLRMIDHQTIDPLTGKFCEPQNPITGEDGRRLDGPTLEEWEAAGYLAVHYPPEGFAPKWTARYEAYVEELTNPPVEDHEVDDDEVDDDEVDDDEVDEGDTEEEHDDAPEE